MSCANCDFAALVLKGQIEHGDSGAYFAAFGGLKYYKDEAIERGWLLPGTPPSVTEAGRAHYESSGLKMVGRGADGAVPPRYGMKGCTRGYVMDWSCYKPKEVPPCR